MCLSRRKHSVGDLVSRLVFMDDGTWMREGDKCLSRSPKRHGIVTAVTGGPLSGYLYEVTFDDGGRGTYFGHGIQAEAP